MPAIDLGGAPFAYREAGAGAPGVPVLFAHCSLAHSGLWKPMLEALAPERPTLAADMPAHGRSAAPGPEQSLQRVAVAGCIALAERVGAPIHMVGLSLGGAVLGRLALERPDLVRSVTLIEPVWFHLLRANGRVSAAEEEEAAMGAVQRTMEAGDPTAAVQAFMDRWGAPGGYERLSPEAREAAGRIYVELARDFDLVVGHPPGQVEAADIALMRPPAMLMSGAGTPRPATEVLDVIADALPAARRRVIEGAGHLSPVTHWQAVLGQLQAFWADVESARA
ncbi:MAG: pimeloyl-ACP methyl ester carboxylesterase [Paracoccaceae bacterium]|jgi:pimeloyl-ACP methyl ester carboxylesterase